MSQHPADSPLDVAIVGGGVAGSYAAYRLRQARTPWRIELFEAVVHQLSRIQPSDLTRIGVPERSNGLGPDQLEVFSLRGVDPTDIVIVRRGSVAPVAANLVFIRDGMFPVSTPPPSLFELVPSLCAYAKPATEGCT